MPYILARLSIIGSQSQMRKLASVLSFCKPRTKIAVCKDSYVVYASAFDRVGKSDWFAEPMQINAMLRHFVSSWFIYVSHNLHHDLRHDNVVGTSWRCFLADGFNLRLIIYLRWFAPINYRKWAHCHKITTYIIFHISFRYPATRQGNYC